MKRIFSVLTAAALVLAFAACDNPAGGDPDRYGVSVSVTGTHTFPGANAGYGAVTALIVTVTNTGNQDTGALSVTLSGTGAGSFALNKTSIGNIGIGGTGTFTVGPNTGLAANTYTATVTVSGGSGIASRSFDLSFTVYPEGTDPPPVYSIELDKTGTHAFDSAPIGYTAIPPLTVTVSNTGNQDTGALTIALSGTNAENYALSAASIGNIGNGGTGTFTVGPNDNLPAGTYTATVTVSGGNGIAPRSFGLSFTVNEAPVYRIELDKTGTYTFNFAAAGYTAIPLLTVTVTNTGNRDTGALTADLSGTNSGSFTLSGSPIAGIPAGGSNTFTVGPVASLAAGTYTAAVTVSGGSGIASRSFDLSFTVMNPFTTTSEAATYLSQVQGGTTPDDPVPLPVKLIYGDWWPLLSVIQTAKKFVALDISTGAMMGVGTNKEFDAGVDNEVRVGEEYIVSLVLPDTAQSIKAGTSGIGVFSYFPGLREVTGANIKTIGEYAFQNCTSLTTLDFPAAVTIKYGAFRGCTALETVNLPVAETISVYVFRECTSLTTLDLPAVVIIDNSAFLDCTSLTTINLPAVATIYRNAFYNCTSLTTLNLPAAVTIGESAFAFCSLTTLNLPESLTSIEGNPFVGCVNLISLTVDSGNQHFKVENDMLLNKAGTTLIAYPSASGAVTLTVSGITSIGDYAFAGFTNLTTLNLPDAVTIGMNAFSSCTALETLDLPAAETIDGNAFAYCTSLTTLDLPAAETIGLGVFTGCTALKTVTLGALAPTLGYVMFYNVTKATAVTVKIPSGAKGYGDISKIYRGGDTEVTWGNGFRGGGWNGWAFTENSSYINTNITLTIYEDNE